MIKTSNQIKNKDAQSLGKRGGLATFKKIGKTGMTTLGESGAAVRWNKKKKNGRPKLPSGTPVKS